LLHSARRIHQNQVSFVPTPAADVPNSVRLDAAPAADVVRRVRAAIARVGQDEVIEQGMIRSFEGEADGITTDAVVDAVLSSIPTRPAEVSREVAAARAG
jgi:hypothetical protein